MGPIKVEKPESFLNKEEPNTDGATTQVNGSVMTVNTP